MASAVVVATTAAAVIFSNVGNSGYESIRSRDDSSGSSNDSVKSISNSNEKKAATVTMKLLQKVKNDKKN